MADINMETGEIWIEQSSSSLKSRRSSLTQCFAKKTSKCCSFVHSFF